ncbi:MAG: outer membrane lipoprotein-sorting protein [Spirochaetaceae bacterium]|jgi:outer membrane lipoprotein-sorting protein|nr:outer membrane lipoprotein-sorting protein [Spirochaetaceae bacterium]
MRNVFVFVVLLSAYCLYGQSADDIVKSSRDRIKSDTVQSQSTMVLTARNGSKSERTIKQYSKDGPNGNRTIVEFLSPATIKGTRFLTMQNKDGGDDRWIYLPELNRVRRIASQEGGKSFMGTDLSYDDISSTDREAGKDTHRILREETLNGNACYVIESVPKDKSYQYGRMISWIDKNNYVNHKLELYDRKGVLVKRYEILELKDVQGRLSPWVSKMTSLNANTSTTVSILQLVYDKALPDNVFTTNYLETGKAN